ncbi:hypothetical protein [Streptomyces sp. 35G-GA-8]|uniref:hypothetical protein n=1 Tax=Streptomyces sp. 35G-GA-8 TaxID=2939434 RepID=UPI00201EFF93|nr:hypothetical protein [Streptomyces sp. 35G-GA-8]MCL7382230.1 hypothetical protein [Streptomyces sp. 35G-GA-8]
MHITPTDAARGAIGRQAEGLDAEGARAKREKLVQLIDRQRTPGTSEHADLRRRDPLIDGFEQDDYFSDSVADRVAQHFETMDAKVSEWDRVIALLEETGGAYAAAQDAVQTAWAADYEERRTATVGWHRQQLAERRAAERDRLHGMSVHLGADAAAAARRLAQRMGAIPEQLAAEVLRAVLAGAVVRADGTLALPAVPIVPRQQLVSPASEEEPVESPAPSSAPTSVPALEAKDILAAAERFPWALAAPGTRHWPDGEFLDVALSTVRTEEREGYIERLEAFVEQRRARLEELLRAYGPGSRPASHGRYALVGRPETLVILERMETHPFGLRAQWEKEREAVLLDDLEFAWGPRIRLSR